MMKKFFVPMAVALLIGPVTSVMADSGPGCGVGAQIFKGQSGLVPHTLAATTNGSTTNQWLGISFNSLGCEETHVVSNEYQRKVFIAANADNIAQNAAQGQGEHLATLAALMGVPTHQKADFFAFAQAHYASVFVAEHTADFYVGLTQAMRSDNRFAQYVN